MLATKAYLALLSFLHPLAYTPLSLYVYSMHSIPNYPDETPLELGHFASLQPFLLEHRHGVSEYSMASLYPFTRKRHYTVSAFRDAQGEEAFLIRGIQWNEGREEIFAMLPKGYPGKELIDDLATRVQEINTIAEDLAPAWDEALTSNHGNLSLVEDRDNADYIYLRKDLIDLSGPSLHKKLVHAHRFSEENPNRVLVPAHLAKSSDMIAVLDQWAEGKDVIEDYRATLLAIESKTELGLRGVVLYTDDTPVAFTLGEEDTMSRFIIHVEKAVTGYRGVYQYINRAFASELPDRIIEINREQDLGIPGLRQAKKTYKPNRMLMKYRIRFN